MTSSLNGSTLGCPEKDTRCGACVSFRIWPQSVGGLSAGGWRRGCLAFCSAATCCGENHAPGAPASYREGLPVAVTAYHLLSSFLSFFNASQAQDGWSLCCSDQIPLMLECCSLLFSLNLEAGDRENCMQFLCTDFKKGRNISKYLCF